MSVTVTPEKEDETFAEQKAIRATLERYVSGARTGDVGLMRLAFVETANIRHLWRQARRMDSRRILRDRRRGRACGGARGSDRSNRVYRKCRNGPT